MYIYPDNHLYIFRYYVEWVLEYTMGYRGWVAYKFFLYVILPPVYTSYLFGVKH